jgi:serine/threonine-protein kinase
MLELYVAAGNLTTAEFHARLDPDSLVVDRTRFKWAEASEHFLMLEPFADVGDRLIVQVGFKDRALPAKAVIAVLSKADVMDGKVEVDRRANAPEALLAALLQKVEELSKEQALEQVSAVIKEMAAELEAVDAKAARRKKWWRRSALVAGLLLLGLAIFMAWWEWRSPADSIAHAASEKGSPLMSPLSNSRPARASTWLCVTFTVGCSAAQVRPLPEDCPREAVKSMEELNLFEGAGYHVVIDINQPGNNQQVGTYSAGPVVSRVVKYEWTGPLPEGTLLYGQLWTEGLTKMGQEAVLGRYTEALLPDGRRVPICFVLGDLTGLTSKLPGSKPGEARLPREWMALAVRLWP